MNEDVKEAANIVSELLHEFKGEIENLPAAMDHKTREAFLAKVERADKFARKYGGSPLNVKVPEKGYKEKFREYLDKR